MNIKAICAGQAFPRHLQTLPENGPDMAQSRAIGQETALKQGSPGRWGYRCDVALKPLDGALGALWQGALVANGVSVHLRITSSSHERFGFTYTSLSSLLLGSPLPTHTEMHSIFRDSL